jgi:hypothetical protein
MHENCTADVRPGIANPSDFYLSLSPLQFNKYQHGTFYILMGAITFMILDLCYIWELRSIILQVSGFINISDIGMTGETY